MVAENVTEELAGDRVGHALGIFEVEDTVTCGLVEAAVTDEVEDVERLATGAATEAVEGGGGEAFELDSAVGFEGRERGLEAFPLTFRIKVRKIARAGEYDEDSQGRADAEGRDGLRKVEIADHWGERGGREEVVLFEVV